MEWEYLDATQLEEVLHIRQEKHGREGNASEIRKANQLK
jgi:hypothetical protein